MCHPVEATILDMDIDAFRKPFIDSIKASEEKQITEAQEKLSSGHPSTSHIERGTEAENGVYRHVLKYTEDDCHSTDSEPTTESKDSVHSNDSEEFVDEIGEIPAGKRSHSDFKYWSGKKCCNARGRCRRQWSCWWERNGEEYGSGRRRRERGDQECCPVSREHIRNSGGFGQSHGCSASLLPVDRGVSERSFFMSKELPTPDSRDVVRTDAIGRASSRFAHCFYSQEINLFLFQSSFYSLDFVMFNLFPPLYRIVINNFFALLLYWSNISFRCMFKSE